MKPLLLEDGRLGAGGDGRLLGGVGGRGVEEEGGGRFEEDGWMGCGAITKAGGITKVINNK